MRVIITAGGEGSRMKAISPLSKEEIYWGQWKVKDWIKKVIKDAELLKCSTNSRWETLIGLTGSCLIIDCDVIPFGIENRKWNRDTIWTFYSEKMKYSNLVIKGGKLVGASESSSSSGFKSSGVYYLKDITETLKKMELGNKNSIAEAMIGADVKVETEFVRLGDVEDYMEALKIKRDYDNYM